MAELRIKKLNRRTHDGLKILAIQAKVTLEEYLRRLLNKHVRENMED